MNLPTSFVRLAALVAVAAAALLPARADMIELTNGDHYLGKVISMTLTNIEFQSEIQGLVKLPRDKIAQITLHPATPRVAVQTNIAAPVPGATAGSIYLSGPQSAPQAVAPQTSTAAPSASAGDISQQLKNVDPKLVAEIQQQVFGKAASPEASAKFNELMGGLSTGNMSVTDIRAMAQNSIKQIQQAKKELGPDAGDALDGYLAILQKFVNESSQ